MKPWVKKAYDTGLLNPISLQRGEFVLKHTGYQVTVREGGVYWTKRHAMRDEIRPGRIGVSFEEVFNNVPKYIQEQMVYHLDIFAAGVPESEFTSRIRGMNFDFIHFDELMDIGPFWTKINWSKKK
jgi:hypothetical protein